MALWPRAPLSHVERNATMGHAYTPGLRVTDETVIRKKRILPIQGNVLVREGDRVQARTVIARTELPGKVHTVNVVNLLSIDANEVRQFMLKKEGDEVRKDEPIAENRPLLKWFKTTVNSPIDGTIENVSEVTGQVLLREPPRPLELLAYIDGTVTEVIPREGCVVETRCAFVQGIFGIGGEVNGPIEIVVKSTDEELTVDKIRPEHKGKILVGGSYTTAAVVKRAVEAGVIGIVVGGFDDKDLREILGYDLGVAITGTEKVGLTLVQTEGFGRIAMAKKTFDLLCSKRGQAASMSGATQIRAGVIRPEIIIPIAAETKGAARSDGKERGGLKAGDVIRVIREPHFGKLAKVKDLPSELRKIGTESHARVLIAEFADGTTDVIPRANVEGIED